MQNKDVQYGQANGCQAFLKSLHIKTGESTFFLQFENGFFLHQMLVSQVCTFEVEHESMDIIPKTFQVKTEQFTFTFKYEKILTNACKDNTFH